MKRSFAAVSAVILVSGVLTGVASPTQAAPSAPSAESAVARADQAIHTHRGAIQATDGESYAVYSTNVDPNGASHVRYTRTYQGLRVYGGDFVMHAAGDGTYLGASNGLLAPLTRMSTIAKVNAGAAAETAKANFAGTITSLGSSELFVDASSGHGRLAWETVVNGWSAGRTDPLQAACDQ